MRLSLGYLTDFSHLQFLKTYLTKNSTMTPPALICYIVAYQWAIHSRLVNASLQCYYPNGEKAEGDSPCNPDTDASFCCGSSSDSSCLNNLLCQDGKGRVIRGSCTDQSWTDPACPQYCLSESWPLMPSELNTLLVVLPLWLLT